MKLAYTIQQASEATGLSRALLYRFKAEGKITFRKSAGRTVILAEDMQAFLESLPIAGRKSGRKAV
jgi:excisionase family DNA binding protein